MTKTVTVTERPHTWTADKVGKGDPRVGLLIGGVQVDDDSYIVSNNVSGQQLVLSSDDFKARFDTPTAPAKKAARPANAKKPTGAKG